MSTSIPNQPTAFGDGSPQSTLGFLEKLLADNLDSPIHGNPEPWAGLIEGLTDNFLSSFPAVGSITWQTQAVQEKAKLVRVALQIIQKTFVQLDELLCGRESLANKVFGRLSSLAWVLKQWENADIAAESILAPSDLQDLVGETMLGLLRSLGGRNSAQASDYTPNWKTLRLILLECCTVISELINSNKRVFPVVVALFGEVKIREVDTHASIEVTSQDISAPAFIPRLEDVPRFLEVFIRILPKTLNQRLECRVMLHGAFQRLDEVCDSVFSYCLEQSSKAAVRAQVSCLAHMIEPTTPARPLSRRVFRLLHRRLLVKSDAWSGLDVLLKQRIPDTLFTRDEIGRIVALLTTSDLSESQKELATFSLEQTIRHVDADTLRFLRQCVQSMESNGPLLLQAEDRLATLFADSQISPTTPVTHASQLPVGRVRLVAIVESILAPLHVDWMDDENEPGHATVQRALDDIQGRFQKPLSDKTLPGRLTLIGSLEEFAVLVVSIVEQAQARVSSALCLHVLTKRLLSGKDSEATAEVRRRWLYVMGQILPITAITGSDQPTVDSLFSVILDGIDHSDRNVRLAAGSALVSLVSCNEAESCRWKSRMRFFVDLYEYSCNLEPTRRETLLSSVGKMGRTTSSELLGEVLHFLVAQLASPNPVLRGIACMQVMDITKFQNKSHLYTLFVPYMDRIAPLLISRIHLDPTFLTEFCRLASMTPANFIQLTLGSTLPKVFGQCEKEVLTKMVQAVNLKASRLFLEHSDVILAYIFRFERREDREQALSFILWTLKEESGSLSGDRALDIQTILKSGLVKLLAELVIGLGDENISVSRSSFPALENVRVALLHPLSVSSSPTADDLSEFLKTHMLGLIAHINDILQDFRGKKTVGFKQKVLRSLGELVKQASDSVSSAAPQIMAMFQTMVQIKELSDVTLSTWYEFIKALKPSELGAHVGPSSAAFLSFWYTFTNSGRGIAKKALEHIVFDSGQRLGNSLDDVVDLSAVPELRAINEQLAHVRQHWSSSVHLQRLLERCSSENMAMATLSLSELQRFLTSGHSKYVADLASGDVFDAQIGQIISVLTSAACREGENSDALRLAAFECIGILGALDPDRCEIRSPDSRMIVLSNFRDDEESFLFAIHLIRDLLVGAFRSTSDIRYQSQLAYTIQELLKYCRFTPKLLVNQGPAPPLKVRAKWQSLPKHVIETVAPLLEARYSLQISGDSVEYQHPMYPHHDTYRQWLQFWVAHLISRVSGAATQVFGVFRSAVRHHDVVVAHHLLPHLVLTVLISGTERDSDNIRSEIIAVLEDQVEEKSTSSPDKKLLSAQAIFMILDHLNRWLRTLRQDRVMKPVENKRSREPSESDQQAIKVDSVLSSLNQSLMATAAFRCKAYARSLMSYERQIIELRERSSNHRDLPTYYDRLHEIYSNLDEPDGMEGVSSLILSPSLEHQIRQHESTGRWTSAQSCWELRLQQSPDNVQFHLGLLRCLRNLGHYDTLRTHITGVLTKHPEWEPTLVGFHVESSWTIGAWDEVKQMVTGTSAQNEQIMIARIMLAMRDGDTTAILEALSAARSVLGTPIVAAGIGGYRRCYDSVMQLHSVHELEQIYRTMAHLSGSQSRRKPTLASLSQTLARRLDATLPTFRIREGVLSMRRTAFALSPSNAGSQEIGRSWLASAKIARKAGQWQTAYSAILQAKQRNTPNSFMENAKLLNATGESLRALQELENSMRLLGMIQSTNVDVDLTLEEDASFNKTKSKAMIIRARWMSETQRFDLTVIQKIYADAVHLQQDRENGHFHLGKYCDDCSKHVNLAREKDHDRWAKMNLYTVKEFGKAIKLGSKYVYQMVPRFLAIWLDMGEDPKHRDNKVYPKINAEVARLIEEIPVYKWFTAFPQIVSRVGHTNSDVYKHLKSLIVRVLHEYPKQGLWFFTSVVKSTKSDRQKRGMDILDTLRGNSGSSREVSKLVELSLAMTNELLALCDHDPKHKKGQEEFSMSMSRHCPRLYKLGESPLLIPLQESLTVSLPPNSASQSDHKPFPSDAPTFQGFSDHIDIMTSLARPRKITIRGSNGQTYVFLGKPKDDLRKDARLMDFNSIINKLLKANVESRKRQLRIRTYGVVTLNEECGFIQWVPNTVPMRHILSKAYENRRVKSWSPVMTAAYDQISTATDPVSTEIYVKKVLPPYQPPVFHEWFIETFPEPSAWLASRLAYSRTLAVMSMVGFILGLGDRHGENILLDANSGEVVHVDFNCLFEKGKTLQVPERVPFRLTHNVVDGLGVTGVEGTFRLSSEVTMQLLRDNRESLMGVLDAFIHDPLVEWEAEKKSRESSRRKNDGNRVRELTDLRALAREAMHPIRKKLQGIHAYGKERHERQMSTDFLVEVLIQEATDLTNLAKMYLGWAAWH